MKSAPKELIRRGLDDGSERLRGQLRDTAQHGQRDSYGGDQIEDAAATGSRQAERTAERLLKRRTAGKGAARADSPPLEHTGPGQPTGADLHAPQRMGAEIKTRDAVSRRETRAYAVKSPQGGSEPVREHGRIPDAGAPPYQRQRGPEVRGDPKFTQGGGTFVQEQGRSLAAKQAERRQRPAAPAPKSGSATDMSVDRIYTGWRHGSYTVPESAGVRPGVSSAHPVRKAGRRAGTSVNTTRSGAKTVGRVGQRTVKTAGYTTQRAAKTIGRTAQTAQKTAAATARTTRRAVQAARATARTAAITAKAAVKTATTAAKAAVVAMKSLVAAIAAGGWVAIVIVVLICLIGLLIASPFGIFFAGDDAESGSVAPAAAVAQINGELAGHLNSLWTSGTYDRMEVQGQPPAWSDVLAVFAAKTAGAEDGVSVVVLDAQRVDLLRAVFWDMTKITTEETEVKHPAASNTPAWAETVLLIRITPRTPDDMRVFYSFTDQQNAALDELLANADMLAALAGDLTIRSQEAKKLLASLPEDLSPERRAVVENALTLYGKVGYFWGGKSLVLGWDSRWGQLTKVWAEGSSTTGTYRPYGLDCSGFVDWVFYNVSGGEYVIGHGGGAMMQHTYCSAITWEEAMPGDLVFYPEDEHVGIVGGWDENGEILVIHCASSQNNVVITGRDGFIAAARPEFYEE